MLVAAGVGALVFLLKMEPPVGFEIAVHDHGAQEEYGLCAGQAPAGAGDRHSVFDEVAACSLDHAGGDGPAHGQGDAVDEVGLFRGEVVDAAFQPGRCGAGLGEGVVVDVQVGDDSGCVALQEVAGGAGDEAGAAGLGRVQVLGSLPEIFELSPGAQPLSSTSATSVT